ncbi:MAG TPA: hypothetical protein VMD25_02555 [Acidobacteriaceae bacterium]|nr:hypothetical protein [Acidobacteriaceae bacterium]
MKRTIILAACLLLCAAPLRLRAQSASQGSPAAQPLQHFYHLKMVVRELSDSGAVTNTRTYEATVTTGDNVSDQVIKTGSRLPIATGSYSGTSSPSISNTQFQYIDLGIDLDVRRVAEVGDGLTFHFKAEVTSTAKYSEIAGVNEPVIRQNAWSSDVIVPLGKPTVVYSSDELDSKGKMQVEVTATPVE